jgi:hypothetical protein
MPGFSEHCKHAQSLHSLASITLTVSQHISDPHTWTKSVASLLSHSPLLSKFHIYSTYITASESMFPDRDLPDLASKVKNARSVPCALAIALARFWTDLVAAHGDTLRRFSVLRMPISLESIKEMCAGCPNLEELFVVANARSVNALPEALTAATKLKTIHVNFPVRSPPVFGVHGVHDNGPEAEEEDEAGGAATGTRTYLVPAEALEIAKRCGPSLTQFGCNTRVWKVSLVLAVGFLALVTSRSRRSEGGRRGKRMGVSLRKWFCSHTRTRTSLSHSSWCVHEPWGRCLFRLW